MPTKGPVTEVEREYVRSKFPQMRVADMAKIMGRSRACVNSIINREGLREKCKRQTVPDVRAAAAPSSPLSQLKELRDMLKDSLGKAGPREMAGLAREYRATVETIERMEGEPDDEAATAFDAIAKSIASRMPS